LRETPLKAPVSHEVVSEITYLGVNNFSIWNAPTFGFRGNILTFGLVAEESLLASYSSKP